MTQLLSATGSWLTLTRTSTVLFVCLYERTRSGLGRDQSVSGLVTRRMISNARSAAKAAPTGSVSRLKCEAWLREDTVVQLTLGLCA